MLSPRTQPQQQSQRLHPESVLLPGCPTAEGWRGGWGPEEYSIEKQDRMGSVPWLLWIRVFHDFEKALSSLPSSVKWAPQRCLVRLA